MIKTFGKFRTNFETFVKFIFRFPSIGYADEQNPTFLRRADIITFNPAPLGAIGGFFPPSLVNRRSTRPKPIFFFLCRIAVRTRRSLRQHAWIVRLQLSSRIHRTPVRDQRQRVRLASVQERRFLSGRPGDIPMRVHAR